MDGVFRPEKAENPLLEPLSPERRGMEVDYGSPRIRGQPAVLETVRGRGDARERLLDEILRRRLIAGKEVREAQESRVVLHEPTRHAAQVSL